MASRESVQNDELSEAISPISRGYPGHARQLEGVLQLINMASRTDCLRPRADIQAKNSGPPDRPAVESGRLQRRAASGQRTASRRSARCSGGAGTATVSLAAKGGGVVNHREQSWRQQKRLFPTTRSKVEDVKKRARPRHRRRKKRVYWPTNFGNWVKFQAPPPNEKVKTAEKAEQIEAPPLVSAATRAATWLSALTQGWRGGKGQLQEEEVRQLQEQVASLQQQMATKESALDDAREKNRAVALASAPTKKRSRSKKKPEKKVERVDLTRVVPSVLQLPGVGGRVEPEYGQTVLSHYKPGDDVTFPGAAYLFPKQATQEKEKQQNVHELKDQQKSDAKDMKTTCAGCEEREELYTEVNEERWRLSSKVRAHAQELKESTEVKLELESNLAKAQADIADLRRQLGSAAAAPKPAVQYHSDYCYCDSCVSIHARMCLMRRKMDM